MQDIYGIGCPSHTPPTGTWLATQACALTGNQISDFLVHRLMLNPRSHVSQGGSYIFNRNSMLTVFKAI